MRTRRALAAVLLGVMVAALGGATAAAEADHGDRVAYHDHPWPGPDLHVITGATDHQREVAARLVDWHKRDFAGSYVDHRSRVVVVSATDRGWALATRAFAGDPMVRVVRGTLSVEAASDLGAQLFRGLPAMRHTLLRWDDDAATSSLRIDVNRAPSGRSRAAVERFADRHDVDIEVYVDRGASQAVLD